MAVVSIALLGALLVPAVALAEAPPAGWTRYDTDTTPGVFQFVGGWGTSSLVPAWIPGSYTVGAWNGSTQRLDAAGSVSFKFVGTGFDWVARAGNIRGIAKVTVDGVVQPTVDLYEAVQTDQKIVLSKTGMANQLHTVVIEWTGTANPANTSGFKFVDIDAIDLPAGAQLVDWSTSVTSVPASSPWSIALAAMAALGIGGATVLVRRRSAGDKA
jgi:MYXO-CTERM domain-containing protein